MRFSFSQLNMALKCGEQYRRRYINGERQPPGFALIRGDAQASAQEVDLKRKIATGDLADEEELLDVAASVVDRRAVPDEVTVDPDDKGVPFSTLKDRTLDQAVRCTKLHHRVVAPVIRPKEVEPKLIFRLPEVDRELIGYIDVFEVDHHIRDSKTTGKRPKPDVARNSDQLALYAYGYHQVYGVESPGQSLDYMVLSQAADPTKARKAPPEKDPNVLPLGQQGADRALRFNAQQTRDDQARAVLRVQEAVGMIEAGVFPPAAEGSWWCDKKWCGFYQTCPYVRGGAVVTVPGVNDPGN